MNKQAEKHSIGLAGEFLVAGELLRRRIRASVVYGNAKKADVVAAANGKALEIEVKTTSKTKWVIGDDLPERSANIWVFVFLPKNEQNPRYFVVNATELHDLVAPNHQAYAKRYFEKHGRGFTGRGVVSLHQSTALAEHENEWSKIERLLTS